MKKSPPPPTPPAPKPWELYAALMNEARTWIDAFNFILPGKTKLVDMIVTELLWLQLRMLCETIALGCLVVHGDVIAAHIKKFEKEYAADKIIKIMERLNPDFFPQQATFTPMPTPSITGNTNPNALKKRELINLYHRCGEMLHRGRFEAMLASAANPAKPNVEEIISWGQKIEDLLGSHVIPLKATTASVTIITCVLRDPSENFKTIVHHVELSRPQPHT